MGHAIREFAFCESVEIGEDGAVTLHGRTRTFTGAGTVKVAVVFDPEPADHPHVVRMFFFRPSSQVPAVAEPYTVRSEKRCRDVLEKELTVNTPGTYGVELLVDYEKAGSIDLEVT
jgi:hypothetical protein